MIETRGTEPRPCAGSLFPPLSRGTSGGAGGGMQKHRIIEGASSPASLESRFLLPGVLPRSSRRVGSRRAGARRLGRDVEGRVIEYLKEHPRSTAGEIAKVVGADRGRVAAELARIARTA